MSSWPCAKDIATSVHLFAIDGKRDQHDRMPVEIMRCYSAAPHKRIRKVRIYPSLLATKPYPNFSGGGKWVGAAPPPFPHVEMPLSHKSGVCTRSIFLLSIVPSRVNKKHFLLGQNFQRKITCLVVDLGGQHCNQK